MDDNRARGASFPGQLVVDGLLSAIPALVGGWKFLCFYLFMPECSLGTVGGFDGCQRDVFQARPFFVDLAIDYQFEPAGHYLWVSFGLSS